MSDSDAVFTDVVSGAPSQDGIAQWTDSVHNFFAGEWDQLRELIRRFEENQWTEPLRVEKAALPSMLEQLDFEKPAPSQPVSSRPEPTPTSTAPAPSPAKPANINAGQGRLADLAKLNRSPTEEEGAVMSGLAAPTVTTYCIFRRGATWFAFPAEDVREVIERPTLVEMPGNKNVLAGICHLRGEFTPVLRLHGLLCEDASGLTDEQQMLVMQDEQGPWAILIDQVVALTALEPSAGDDIASSENWTAAISGWAAWESESVRVLNPRNFRDLTEREFEQSWRETFAEEALKR